VVKHLTVRSLGLGLLLLLTFAQLPRANNAQANSAQANNAGALAYVDSGGNIQLRMPGAAQSTGVTSDADFKLPSGAAVHNYAHLRWSPDGSKLAFEDIVTNDLLVAVSGNPPQRVASGISTQFPPAWLPDNNTVAYVVDTQQSAGGTATTMNIQQVSSSGGQAQTVGTFVEFQGCGGGSSDPATILYYAETGLNGNAPTFAWTKSGWLYSSSCDNIGLALNGFNNQQQWRIENLGRVAVAPDGDRAAGILFDLNRKPSSLVYIDLATGRNGALNAVAGIDQVGWSADGALLLYSTVDQQGVSLWKIPVQGGQATRLFSDQGKFIGTITTMPDMQWAVFSYIPGGDNPQPQILSTAINGPATNLASATNVTQGSAPAFAPLTPQIANPIPTPTVAVACTPRTDWTFTYTVAPGDTLANLARLSGTTLDALAAGNCLANPNIIFAGQVLRLPVAIQAPPPGIKRIVFQTGAFSATVQGQVGAFGTDRWVLRALAGQTMSAQLSFAFGQAILIVYGADGTVLQSDHATSSIFSGVLPATQDYFIDVRGNPNTATSYTLTVTVPPLAAQQPTATRIVFQRGTFSTTVQGQVAPSGINRWVLRALAGQTMFAQLAFTSGQAILVVFGADGTVLLSDHAGASNFSSVLPLTQDYFIDVRGNPNTTTTYSLTITVPPR
jgi:LysM repeat protein